MPFKLACGHGGSYYAIGFHPDEFDDAQRLQPLIDDSTPFNTINGIQDPTLKSPYYFEDVVRPVLGALHFDIFLFFWLWRIFFPVVLLLLLILIGRECFAQRHGWLLPAAAAAAALPLLACAHDLVRAIPAYAKLYAPLQGWLHRVPANIEYILSALIVLLALRLLKRPGAGRGIALSSVLALSVYVRIFVAVAWAPVIACVVLWLVAGRRQRFSAGAAMFAVFALLVTPWVLDVQANRASPVFTEFVARCFVDLPYQIMPMMGLYVGAAVLLFVLGLFVADRFRPLITMGALVLLALPFVGGLLPYSSEVLKSDRFGQFYWIALAAAAIVSVGAYAVNTRCEVKVLAWPLCALAIIASTALTLHNYHYDFMLEVESPYRNVATDQNYLTAYHWIRDHVSDDALFLVDDGYDWALAFDGSTELDETAPDNTQMLTKADLFQLVARRKRVYNEHVKYSGLSYDQYMKLMIAHRGTLGFPFKIGLYDSTLMNVWPTHILWRKLPLNPISAAEVPRGFGVQLKKFRHVVYQDEFCEVWELNFAMTRPIYRGPTHPLPDVGKPVTRAPFDPFYMQR